MSQSGHFCPKNLTFTRRPEEFGRERRRGWSVRSPQFALGHRLAGIAGQGPERSRLAGSARRHLGLCRAALPARTRLVRLDGGPVEAPHRRRGRTDPPRPRSATGLNPPLSPRRRNRMSGLALPASLAALTRCAGEESRYSLAGVQLTDPGGGQYRATVTDGKRLIHVQGYCPETKNEPAGELGCPPDVPVMIPSEA